MKYCFIGDIHGKYNLMKKIVEQFSDSHKMIFVGDFVDSYNESRTEQLKCIELILELIKNNKAESVLGNHEMSYLFKEHECSGRSNDFYIMLLPYLNDILKYFKYYIYLENDKILITHAGLTKQIWDDYNLNFNNLKEFLEFKTQSNNNLRLNPLHYIAFSRGGNDNYGGIFWCDWNEEFKPISELKQIMGHTRYSSTNEKGIRIKESYNFNIDCLDNYNEILEYDDETKQFDII